MNELNKSLDTIKTIDWDSAAVSFFVVKRKLIQRSAKYDIFHVNVDEPLRKKLRSITSGKIKKSNGNCSHPQKKSTGKQKKA